MLCLGCEWCVEEVVECCVEVCCVVLWDYVVGVGYVYVLYCWCCVL